MRVEDDDPVSYFFRAGDNEVYMNELIGSRIKLEYSGGIFCIKCGRKTSKSFAQGYCYPCFISAPETEECVLRPELCRAHEGKARDMEFARQHCLIEHVVYLSLTSKVKVGVTRNTQVPVRWIDQGAVQAFEIARTPNRYLAGMIEVGLKKHVSDKTHWRNMLKNLIDESVDLVTVANQLREKVEDDLSGYMETDYTSIKNLKYPVMHYPEKIKSINLDKQFLIEDVLTGIKGQYLMFGDYVINIRKYGGYMVTFSA